MARVGENEGKLMMIVVERPGWRRKRRAQLGCVKRAQLDLDLLRDVFKSEIVAFRLHVQVYQWAPVVVEQEPKNDTW